MMSAKDLNVADVRPTLWFDMTDTDPDGIAPTALTATSTGSMTSRRQEPPQGQSMIDGNIA
jgi:hypothetical protein